MQQYVTFKNIELLLFIVFTGCSIAFHSLWPGVSVVLGMLARQALTDYYNYKHADMKLIESTALSQELNEIRQAHQNMEKTVNTVNESINSVRTALTLGRSGR